MVKEDLKKSDKMTLEEALLVMDPSVELGFWGAIIFEPFVRFIHWIQRAIFGVKPAVGAEILLEQSAIIEQKIIRDGKASYRVFIEGERWNLICAQNLEKGEKVRISGIKGLTLIGEKIGL